MRNQKQINVEKFSRMWWRYEGGKLTARQEISRDPFGKFEIRFRQSVEGGAVVLSIVNKDFYMFNLAETKHESFTAAVSAVAKYFEEIDEYAKKTRGRAREEARKASNRIIVAEIEKYMKEVVAK